MNYTTNPVKNQDVIHVFCMMYQRVRKMTLLVMLVKVEKLAVKAMSKCRNNDKQLKKVINFIHKL